jgi:hypothetical protein
MQPNEQLTEHFTLAELTVTSHRDIDNTPSDAIVEKLKYTARGLEHVRLLLGVPILVSSGYRSSALNCVVGGAMSEASLVALRDTKPSGEVFDICLRRLLELLFGAEDSQHMKGEAVDFIAPKYGTPLDVARHLAASDLRFDQIIFEGTWVHISFVDYRQPRLSLLTWRKGAGYDIGLIG